MFGPRKAAATYAAVDLEARVTSASQHELIQMLFDGAILALNQACAAIAAKDIGAKGQATSRAVSIIEEGLRASLDKNQGGTLAESLDGLYEYMSQRLLLASMRGDVNGFLEVKKLLSELRGAWSSIRLQPINGSIAKPELTALPGGRAR
ncbi:MAG: flagellar export chaperone FliS [Burkholderiales bacterium]